MTELYAGLGVGGGTMTVVDNDLKAKVAAVVIAQDKYLWFHNQGDRVYCGWLPRSEQALLLATKLKDEARAEYVQKLYELSAHCHPALYK